MTPESLARWPAPAAVAETHSAVLWLVGDRVYKRKKPVRFDFLDFSTVAARRAVCAREVELNRRLAPDVYLGVGELREPDRPAEPIVVMVRMPEPRRLSTLARQGADVGPALRDLARLMARFHAAAPRSPDIDRAATWEVISHRWAGDLAEVRPFAGGWLDGAVVARIAGLAERYLAGRAALFARRIADGCICDGHGDLLADDVFCLPDGPRVLDCIEFDDRLRHLDVLADLAFLAMDLDRLGAPGRAADFLAAYAEYAGAWWPSSLAHFYVAHRALIRAMVSCLRAAQGDSASAGPAAGLAELCRRHLEAAAVRLVLIGGPPGTGKTTVAGGLAARLGWVHLRSDVVRKELAGPSAHPPGGAFAAGRYAPAATAATYTTLLERAGTALGLGESVLLDASWADARWRARARAVAAAASAELVEVRCEAAPAVAAARVAARAAAGADASDATPEIAARIRAGFDPWPTAAVVSTEAGRRQAVEQALAQVRNDAPHAAPLPGLRPR